MSDGTLFPAKVSIRGKNVFVNGHVFYIHNVAGDGDCLFHCFNESEDSNEKRARISIEGLQILQKANGEITKVFLNMFHYSKKCLCGYTRQI